VLRILVWVETVVALALAAFAFYGTVAGPFTFLGLGIALPALLHSVRDWWERRGNSIAADYESHETGVTRRDKGDIEVDGTFTRMVRIGQRGTRIEGEEVTMGKLTKWKIRGEVFGEFLAGTWAQTSPASITNKGVFFGQRDPENSERFHGQWLGWVTGKGSQGVGDWEWIRQPKRPFLQISIHGQPVVPRK
jgi:hypothetical protein